MPILDVLLRKNPIYMFLGENGWIQATLPVVSFAKDRMAERLTDDPEKVEAEEIPDGPSDLLSKFLKAQRDHPEFMDDSRVLTMAASMAFAGSETT